MINKVAEPTFAAKIIEKTSNVDDIEYEGPKDDAIDKTYLIDKIFIQGLSHNR